MPPACAEPDFVHVASETIAAFAPELGPTLVGDKAHSVLFDNSKVTALVPEFRTTITFDEGARRILAHYDAHPDEQRVDADRDDALFDGSRPTPVRPADAQRVMSRTVAPLEAQAAVARAARPPSRASRR